MQLNDRLTRDVRHRSVVGPDLGPRRCLRVNGTRQGAALQIQLHGSGFETPCHAPSRLRKSSPQSPLGTHQGYLAWKEVTNLRYQIGTSSSGYGGRRQPSRKATIRHGPWHEDASGAEAGCPPSAHVPKHGVRANPGRAAYASPIGPGPCCARLVAGESGPSTTLQHIIYRS